MPTLKSPEVALQLSVLCPSESFIEHPHLPYTIPFSRPAAAKYTCGPQSWQQKPKRQGLQQASATVKM
jgi:hypothetical protein